MHGHADETAVVLTHMRTRNTAFTLIELLVVIAIIAILAAVLFPVFATIKAKSRQVECASNLKQIMVAILSYSDDWGNRLPGLNIFGDLVDGQFTLSHPGTASKGKGPLWAYIKTKAIFVCPDDLQHRRPYDPDRYAPFGGFNYTYTMNSYMTLASSSRPLADISGESINKSRNPTRTILIVDENTNPHKGLCAVNDAHFATGDSTCDRHPGSTGYSRDNGSMGVPEGCANVGYLDGHTGTVPGLLRFDSTAGKKIFLR